MNYLGEMPRSHYREAMDAFAVIFDLKTQSTIKHNAP
jgi:hypothetical protein